MAKTTEQKIAHVNGTMAMENMPLKSTDKKMLQDYYEGKTTIVQAKEKIISQHMKKNG